jgi:indole-3-glycerol phosphate synthase
MSDYLDILLKDAETTIQNGYYNIKVKLPQRLHVHTSLKGNILKCAHTPVIAEVKLSSPSRNYSLKNSDLYQVTTAMEKGGATAISFITEPEHFKGSLLNFINVRKTSPLPFLMKDIIISKTQINAAHKIGADAILLIQTLFDREYVKHDLSEMIRYANSKDLEVLLETHTEQEFFRAIKTDAEMIGINNRDLTTLKVQLRTTKKILTKYNTAGRIIVSESGIKYPFQIRMLKKTGATAFLIGTSIITSSNVEKKVRNMVEA